MSITREKEKTNVLTGKGDDSFPFSFCLSFFLSTFGLNVDI